MAWWKFEKTSPNARSGRFLVSAEWHALSGLSGDWVKHLYWHNAVAIYVGGTRLGWVTERVSGRARGAQTVFWLWSRCLLPQLEMVLHVHWVYIGNGDLVTAPAVRPFWDSSTAVQGSNGLEQTKLATD